MAFAIASGASAQSIKDNVAVTDKNGNLVRAALSGNCVRTKWETKDGSNPCAIAQPEPAKVVVTPTITVTPIAVLKEKDKTIHFDFDSAQLSSQAQSKLDILADSLNQTSEIKKVTIYGYADEIGKEDYNQQLSMERANAVKNYLANRGYTNTQTATVKGFGESYSVVSCDNTSNIIACNQPNRRVWVGIEFINADQAKIEVNMIKQNQPSDNS